jgi:hypothetical protein
MRPARVRNPQHLAGYTCVPPFAWSGWRLRIPGGPVGGQYHGFIAADSHGWPGGHDEISSPDHGSLGDVDIVSDPWNPVWGGTVLREGQQNSDHVFRTSAEMRPRPNASGGANVVHGFQRRRTAGFAEAPGNYRALGAMGVPAGRGGRLPYINPNIVNNPNAPRAAIHILSQENPTVMTTPSGEQVVNINGQDVPVGAVAGAGGFPGVPFPSSVSPVPATPGYPQNPAVIFGTATPGSLAQTGATSVVSQPAPATPGYVPYGANLVQATVPPVSPTPAPTVSAPPSSMVPSTGQPLPVAAGSPWQPNYAYPLGSVITDSNGNLQQSTAVGTSGATAPGWATVAGTTTSDGSVVWTMIGPSSAVAAASSSSFSAWFSQSTIIAGVPNLYIAIGAGLALFLLMRGRK